jgi:hypothetical protein
MKYYPKHKENPHLRQPTIIVDPTTYDALPIRVRFDLLDDDHPHWGWDFASKEHLLEFLKFLKSVDKTKWFELKGTSKTGSFSRGTKHHSIEIAKFRKSARERLDKLNLQRLLGDKLFSIAINATTRVYGGRDKEFFRPIWHDPFHEYGNEKSAYPLEKK